MFAKLWTISHVLVLAAVVLGVLAFFASEGWLGFSNWAAWITTALVAFFASLLPWRTATP